MKINIAPNLDQIRFFAKSAMHAWDFQDLETGRKQAIADMKALLRYLDAFDDGMGLVVTGISKIEGGIRLERSRRYGQILDLSHGYVDPNAISHHSGDGQGAFVGIVEDMGPERNGSTAETELDFAPLSDGDAKR
jgi:hypothetical protein